MLARTLNTIKLYLCCSKQCVTDHMRLKIAESMNSNHKRDLWTELKKINEVNRKTANSVDGYVSDKDIAEVFCQ